MSCRYDTPYAKALGELVDNLNLAHAPWLSFTINEDGSFQLQVDGELAESDLQKLAEFYKKAAEI